MQLTATGPAAGRVPAVALRLGASAGRVPAVALRLGASAGRVLAVALLLGAGASCDGGGGGGAPAARFAIACDSADTTQQSTLFCVRTDTRTGDVMVVDLDRLPITSGASRAAEAPAGTYQTVCDSTVTPQKSDFGCVRLHTGTGELVVLRLSELPHWPR